MKKDILAIIPARGGSKSIPGKNIYHLNGKPLIYWTINAALVSEYVQRTIVSSDSGEILRLAGQFSAEPLLRPTSLALDHSSSESVILHVLDELKEKENYEPAYFILLQPTSPLRTAEDIDLAFDEMFTAECSSIISGYTPDKHPLKYFLVGKQGNLEPILDESYPFKPRQELPLAFCPNGAIYIMRTQLFREIKTLLAQDTMPFFMSEEKSIDIDTIDDMKKASIFLTGMSK